MTSSSLEITSSFHLQVATFVPFVMMLKAEFKARFNSVERVCQYANVSVTHLRLVTPAHN